MPETIAPPAGLQLRVTDAAAGLYQLALRRQAWLDTATSDGASEALAEVGAALDTGLADVAAHTEVLRRAFAEYPGWCNDRIADALASGPLDDAQRAALGRATGVRDGDYAAVAERLAGEAVEVAAGTRRRITGGPAAGSPLAFDAHDTGCALLAFSAMGGLATCPKTLGAGCAVGAGSMIALAAFC